METEYKEVMEEGNVLKLMNVSKIFGGLNAVSNVSLEVNRGEIIGLIGPNGAGKTTLFNVISGVYEPSAGEVYVKYKNKEVRLNKVKPYRITQYGLARTFQNIRLFKTRTVIDNVKIAMNKDCTYNLFDSLVRTNHYYAEEKRIQEEAMDILEVVGIKDKCYELSINLPYGEQRLLEIARALATKPSILFLDEPAAGMNPNETQTLVTLIKEIRNRYDITIVLIEHDMSLVMSMCEKIFVLEQGVLIATGNAEEIKNNKRVIEAYLGKEDEETQEEEINQC